MLRRATARNPMKKGRHSVALWEGKNQLQTQPALHVVQMALPAFTYLTDQIIRHF
jgi:hypothetical protein